ncbi:hypothetical protein BH18ACT7_BH18ACT7_02850 [soil metagenome]
MRAAYAALAGILLVTGCGGGDAPEQAQAPQSGDLTVTPDADGVQAVTLVTQDNFRFVPAEFTVVPGRVRVTVDNPSSNVHNLRYDEGGPGEEIPVVRPGQEESIDFTVSTPGEYAFVCTFHSQFDQRGTMIVLPDGG